MFPSAVLRAYHHAISRSLTNVPTLTIQTQYIIRNAWAQKEYID